MRDKNVNFCTVCFKKPNQFNKIIDGHNLVRYYILEQVRCSWINKAAIKRKTFTKQIVFPFIQKDFCTSYTCSLSNTFSSL